MEKSKAYAKLFQPIGTLTVYLSGETLDKKSSETVLIKSSNGVFATPPPTPSPVTHPFLLPASRLGIARVSLSRIWNYNGKKLREESSATHTRRYAPQLDAPLQHLLELHGQREGHLHCRWCTGSIGARTGTDRREVRQQVSSIKVQ